MGRKDKAKRAAATKKGGKIPTSKSKDELNENEEENETNEETTESTEEKSKENADTAGDKSEKDEEVKESAETNGKSEEKTGKDEKIDDDLPSNGGKMFPRMSEKERAKYDADHRLVTGVLESQKFALDVKIGGFSLIFHGKELVKDTSLEFTIGRRYGLLGSNGSGKSQLLKCISLREVPIPEHIDIYLLEEEAEPSDMTAVQWVVDEARKEVARLEAEAEQVAEEDPDGELISDIYTRLEDMDPDTFEPRAGKLLHGLGFSEEMMKKRTRDMSGGWRMRVALAKALFVKPTLLLLDEPTNHLDLEAVVWLENYLSTYNRCLVIISHSQDFLNSVCTHVMHLTPKKTLLTYTGNYDQFMKTKSEQEVNQMKQYEKEQADIAHIRTIVAKAGTYKNTVRQAKSREKVIEKMQARGLTEKVLSTSAFTFRFPPCDKLPPPVLQLENLSFAYSGNLKDALYTNVNLGVDLDSRVAIVGPNGTGKSTLLKLMLGELQPTEGLVKKHIHLSIARYNQHSNDVLDPTMSTLDFIRKEFGQDGKTNEQEWRGLIGKYGISGSLQNVQIGKLSDGYRTRIVFGMMALRKPHMLLLDEPTNHLDMESIDGLAEAIKKFEGGMILVSHDFRLIDQVAQTIWVVGDKNIKIWKGDIRSYKQSLIDKMKKAEAEEAKNEKAASWKAVKI